MHKKTLICNLRLRLTTSTDWVMSSLNLHTQTAVVTIWCCSLLRVPFKFTLELGLLVLMFWKKKYCQSRFKSYIMVMPTGGPVRAVGHTSQVTALGGEYCLVQTLDSWSLVLRRPHFCFSHTNTGKRLHWNIMDVHGLFYYTFSYKVFIIKKPLFFISIQLQF